MDPGATLVDVRKALKGGGQQLDELFAAMGRNKIAGGAPAAAGSMVAACGDSELNAFLMIASAEHGLDRQSRHGRDSRAIRFRDEGCARPADQRLCLGSAAPPVQAQALPPAGRQFGDHGGLTGWRTEVSRPAAA